MKNFLFLAFTSFVLSNLISCGGRKIHDEYYPDTAGSVVNEQSSTVSSASSESSSSQQTQQESITNETTTGGHAGTYEVTDVNGKKWIFVLNPDETVVVEDGGNTYYGEWGDRPYMDDNPQVSFPSDDYPELQFPKIDKIHDSKLVIDVENGFIYGYGMHNLTYKSKNPKKRLKIKKIK